MPKQPKNPLKTKTARATLPVDMRPYWQMVSPGVGLGYRRTASGAGRWIVRSTHGKQWLRKFAIADDLENANGTTVLSYEQAQDRARSMVRSGRGAPPGDSTRPGPWTKPSTHTSSI